MLPVTLLQIEEMRIKKVLRNFCTWFEIRVLEEERFLLSHRVLRRDLYFILYKAPGFLVKNCFNKKHRKLLESVSRLIWSSRAGVCSYGGACWGVRV